MEPPMQAIEVTGVIDEEGWLHLDEALTNVGRGPVRVILLLRENGEVAEEEWLKAGAGNSAFDFLRDPVEDIYTIADGKPFNDQG